MENAYTSLAKMFKENENKSYLGAMLAEVIEPMPNLKIKLLNGNMELSKEIEGDNLFISETLTNRLDVQVTFKDFESKTNEYKNGTDSNNSYNSLSANGGSVVHPSPSVCQSTGTPNSPLPPSISSASFSSGSISEIKTPKHKNEQENKEKGKLKIQLLVTLKKGDKVLVIPNETEDQFYIIDVFHNVKEVKDKWEYYQKS